MTTSYVDFSLDPSTGDLDLSGNDLTLISSNQLSLRQRIFLRFAIWNGDWYFDETFGFPYRTFIPKRTVQAVLDGRIKEEVRSEPDVLEISSFESTMDVVSRSYACYFTVTTAEGEEVSLAFLGSDSYSYPTPPDSNVTLCGDEGTIITFKNKLYYLINFRLPAYGDSTWNNRWR